MEKWWMGGWMDGWMNGQVDGWMDGWMDEYENPINKSSTSRVWVYGPAKEVNSFSIVIQQRARSQNIPPFWYSPNSISHRLRCNLVICCYQSCGEDGDGGGGGGAAAMGISKGQITSALSTQNRTLSPNARQRCQLIQSECPCSDAGHSHR